MNRVAYFCAVLYGDKQSTWKMLPNSATWYSPDQDFVIWSHKRTLACCCSCSFPRLRWSTSEPQEYKWICINNRNAADIRTCKHFLPRASFSILAQISLSQKQQWSRWAVAWACWRCQKSSRQMWWCSFSASASQSCWIVTWTDLPPPAGPADAARARTDAAPSPPTPWAGNASGTPQSPQVRPWGQTWVKHNIY